MADSMRLPASLPVSSVSGSDSGDKLQPDVLQAMHFLKEIGFLDNMASLREAGFLPEESARLEQMPNILSRYVQADLVDVLSDLDMSEQLNEIKEIGKIYGYLKDKAPFDDGIQDERQEKIGNFNTRLSQFCTPIDPVRCLDQAFVEHNAAYRRLDAAIETMEAIQIQFQDKGNAWDYADILCKKNGPSQEKSDVMETLRSAINDFLHRYAEEVGNLERCYRDSLPAPYASKDIEKSIKTFQEKTQDKFSAWENGVRTGILQLKAVKFKALLHAMKKVVDVPEKSGVSLLQAQENFKRIRQEVSKMAKTWAEAAILSTFRDEEGAFAEPSGKVKQVLEMVMDHIASKEAENRQLYSQGTHMDDVFYRNQMKHGNSYCFAHAASELLAGNVEHEAKERRDLSMKTALYENRASRQSHSRGLNAPDLSSHAGEKMAAERLAAVFNGTLNAGSGTETPSAHASSGIETHSADAGADAREALVGFLRQRDETLSDSPSPSEINRSYRQVVRELHPDKMAGREEECKQLSNLHAAYELKRSAT